MILDEDEHATLSNWTRSRNCSQALAVRARIVLACAQQDSSTAAAERLGVSVDMVRKWRSRFIAERLQGLTERHRPGRPAHLDVPTVTEVLVRLLSPTPSGRRWSTRSMATAVGISQTAVSRIWRTYRIGSGQTHPTAAQEDGSTVLPAQIRDVVGLYLDPPARVLAVASDGQAAPLQERSTATASMQRRTAKARETFAVANAFAQVNGNGKAGSAADGAPLQAFLERLERSVPASMTVHLLVDGVNPADQRTLTNRLDEQPRFRQHAVPLQGCWLGEIDALLRRNPLPNHENVLGYGASLEGLREELRAWCSTSTPPARPFAWTKSPRSLWRGDRDYHGLINDSYERNDAHTGEADTADEASGLSRSSFGILRTSLLQASIRARMRFESVLLNVLPRVLESRFGSGESHGVDFAEISRDVVASVQTELQAPRTLPSSETFRRMLLDNGDFRRTFSLSQYRLVIDVEPGLTHSLNIVLPSTHVQRDWAFPETYNVLLSGISPEVQYTPEFPSPSFRNADAARLQPRFLDVESPKVSEFGLVDVSAPRFLYPGDTGLLKTHDGSEILVRMCGFRGIVGEAQLVVAPEVAVVGDILHNIHVETVRDGSVVPVGTAMLSFSVHCVNRYRSYVIWADGSVGVVSLRG